MTSGPKVPDHARLDRVVAEARRGREKREQGYRERALKIYPWICGRCGREFDQTTVQQLTVHHRDHNHDNNPADGSNWELLCVYCHEDEHLAQRKGSYYGDYTPEDDSPRPLSSNPFEGLKGLITPDNDDSDGE